MAADDQAFEEFFRTQVASVVATAFRITGDREVAEDIAQDAFYRAAARWRRLRRYDRPGAWVRRVAIRDAVRASRKASRYDRTRSVAAASDSRSHRLWSGDHVPDDDVWAAVRSLPGQQRAAVVLYYVEGVPTCEVAGLLGCSDATVRSHLRAARQRLAHLLGDHDEGVVPNASR